MNSMILSYMLYLQLSKLCVPGKRYNTELAKLDYDCIDSRRLRQVSECPQFKDIYAGKSQYRRSLRLVMIYAVVT